MFVSVSDDEFSTHLPANMYLAPTKIYYPNAHPDLCGFHQTSKSPAERESVPPMQARSAPSSTLGVCKSPPVTTSFKTSRVVKSVKVTTGGTQGHIWTSDFDELTKAVLKDTITVYKGHLFTNGAFLEHAEEYDLAVKSFVFVCKTRNIQMEIDDDLMKLVCLFYPLLKYCNHVCLQVTQHSSQACRDCKSKAHLLVAPAFGISSEKPIREVCNLVEDLLDHMNFLYKVQHRILTCIASILTPTPLGPDYKIRTLSEPHHPDCPQHDLVQEQE